MSFSTFVKSKQLGPWANLIFSVVLPSVLLKHLGEWAPSLSPVSVLVISILPPLAMGAKELIDSRTVNFFSILGIINVGLTGGFGILQLSGTWFILKEAALPLALGIASWISSYSQNPILGLMLFNEQLLDRTIIETRLVQTQKLATWKHDLKTGTKMFAGSFLLSAALNAVVALYTFSNIDHELPPEQQAKILNEQIAQMTWLGFVVIALPCLVISGLSLFWILKRLSRLTGWTFEELLEKREQLAGKA